MASRRVPANWRPTFSCASEPLAVREHASARWRPPGRSAVDRKWRASEDLTFARSPRSWPPLERRQILAKRVAGNGDDSWSPVTIFIVRVQRQDNYTDRYSTVTDLARLRGWSMLQPRA